MMKRFTIVLMALAMFVGCTAEQEDAKIDTTKAEPVMATIYDGEKHLTNVRQISFGGQNAEAYFSYDASELIFQAMVDSMECDQIFRMNVDGSNVRPISNGAGVTTCSFIAPDNKSVIYASTYLAGDECLPKPDHSRGYVWPLYNSFDIFKADPDGSNIVRLTETDGYDAEAVYSPKGDKIIFTSVRNSDLDLYIMNPDGSGVEQITDEIGYDGGAFFGINGEWIVWRASRPEGKELEDYQSLLAEGMIRPSKLNLYIMNLTERKPIQLTDNGKANFGPYFHPDGKHIIFCSNLASESGRDFDLFLINIDTKEIEQVTYNKTFDGFPMFSHDGKTLVFASNRDNKITGETNVFIADWVW